MKPFLRIDKDREEQKKRVEDLALFGGEPAFAEPLHVGRPNIGDRGRLMERINRMLDNRWLSNNGPYVQELERTIAEMVGVKHCIAMCNGTIALEIAIRSLGLQGEVIVPSFTFVATAHALQWQEITPVFCDIDARSYTLDAAWVERMITPRTTGIIGVHLWGRPCDIEAIQEIARQRGLRLLFDAAHAFGCTYKGRPIGGFGDAEVFSFHATKFFSTAEGGAITTNDDELAAKIRLMKNFGFHGYDTVVYVGTNGKMNEFSALMGLTNLECLEDFVEANYRNYRYYEQGLEGVPGVTLISYDPIEKSNYQYVILEVDPAVTGLTRDQLVDVLRAENVLARRYFFPGCHKMEPYRSFFPHAGLVLPQTERLAKRTIALPTGTAVGPHEIFGVCGIIRLVVDRGPEIQARLASGGTSGYQAPMVGGVRI